MQGSTYSRYTQQQQQQVQDEPTPVISVRSDDQLMSVPGMSRAGRSEFMQNMSRYGNAAMSTQRSAAPPSMPSSMTVVSTSTPTHRIYPTDKPILGGPSISMSTATSSSSSQYAPSTLNGRLPPATSKEVGAALVESLQAENNTLKDELRAKVQELQMIRSKINSYNVDPIQAAMAVGEVEQLQRENQQLTREIVDLKSMNSRLESALRNAAQYEEGRQQTTMDMRRRETEAVAYIDHISSAIRDYCQELLPGFDPMAQEVSPIVPTQSITQETPIGAALASHATVLGRLKLVVSAKAESYGLIRDRLKSENNRAQQEISHYREQYELVLAQNHDQAERMANAQRITSEELQRLQQLYERKLADAHEHAKAAEERAKNADSEYKRVFAEVQRLQNVAEEETKNARRYQQEIMKTQTVHARLAADLTETKRQNSTLKEELSSLQREQMFNAKPRQQESMVGLVEALRAQLKQTEAERDDYSRRLLIAEAHIPSQQPASQSSSSMPGTSQLVIPSSTPAVSLASQGRITEDAVAFEVLSRKSQGNFGTRPGPGTGSPDGSDFEQMGRPQISTTGSVSMSPNSADVGTTMLNSSNQYGTRSAGPASQALRELGL